MNGFLFFLRSYHDCISIVNQEPVFFGRSIRENIAYGFRTQLSDDQIMEAAKVANAQEFIQSFRAGLDTQVKKHAQYNKYQEGEEAHFFVCLPLGYLSQWLNHHEGKI